MQQYLRVTRHRSGYVAEHDQWRRPRKLAVARDGQDLAALAQALADGPPQVGHRSQRIGAQPARAAQVERQHQAADLALRRGDLLGAHGLEVHPLQPFAVRDGQHRVLHRRFVLRPRLRFARLCHGFGDATTSRRRAVLALFLLRLEQSHGDGLFSGGRVAPEQVKRLVEHVLVLVAVQHGRAQCGACLGPAAEIDQRQRLLSGERFSGADGQPRAPQQVGEVHDVRREGGGWRGHRGGGRRTRARGGCKRCGVAIWARTPTAIVVPTEVGTQAFSSASA